MEQNVPFHGFLGRNGSLEGLIPAGFKGLSSRIHSPARMLPNTLQAHSI
jgi:hypothetical protein